MANSEHLERLRQGRKAWHAWRVANLETKPDLSRVDLFQADLVGANLSGADLSGADLSRADLIGADLSGADLRGAYLGEAALNGADLRGAALSEVNLSGADLSEAALNGADLSRADLCGANLTGVELIGADLSRANFFAANLSGINLRRAQVLATNFSNSTFTSACLEDWNLNSATNFEGTICDYVYLKADQQERRPREGNFKPGEFAALFQQALDTVDLIFKDGIDWQAFFQSFQELRSQYVDQELAIQAIEKKQDGAFIVRLEVAEGTDKSVIEISAKELYETKLVLAEQRYRDVLQAKDSEIVAYREQSANLLEIIKLQASRPINVEATAVADNSNRKNDLRGAQFAGGYAETVQGDQIGGTINNYGSNAADIERLITALRDQAQAFPEEHKDDALDTLDDLQSDLAKPEPDKARIGRRLKKLGAIATLTAATTAAAVGFSADLAQLADYLEVPATDIIQVEPE